ncbi:hypothetical protein DCAR_0103558 [Daucus carota subsp. sativus]|uniref:ATP-dependent Clp protease proteolytic subunit n=1 Tax=Daucus carota subsp. sativus TaxID=79200 RepID=A0AAF1ALE7_DAUCS|nr:hypothetical protein DCAR_0103558 [Daucus carota subsp. sativus]
MTLFPCPKKQVYICQVNSSSLAKLCSISIRHTETELNLLSNMFAFLVVKKIVYIVLELVVAQVMYLQWMDLKDPIYLYMKSRGTVGMEMEGFAIYDARMQLKNEMHTVAAAIVQACLLLAAGSKGKRFMMPYTKAMIQQPRVPSSGLMPATDLLIRAKEHTGNSLEAVANVKRHPFYMDSIRAKKTGVIDKILWHGQETIMAGASLSEDRDKIAGIKVLVAV